MRQRAKLDMSLVAWYPGAPNDAPATKNSAAATRAATTAAAADDGAGSTPPGLAYRGMRETVRIVPGQVQYVDGLTLGALVRVDLVTRPVQQRLEAATR